MAKSDRELIKGDNILSKLEDELIEGDPDIFDNLTQDKKKNLLIAVKKTLTKIYSGPLPDPETLREYENIMPGSADRVFKEFEEQGKHRRLLEEHALRCQFKQSNRGQNFAFIICMAFLVVSGILIYLQHDWAGGTLGVGSLTGLVTVFIQGRSYQQKNLQDKKPK